jgi:hypothetical protein
MMNHQPSTTPTEPNPIREAVAEQCIIRKSL